MAQFYSAKRRVTTRKIITVEITDLDVFGQGVARYQNKTLFISGALPGETADVCLTQEKRNYSLGTVKRRLNDSPERVAPRCPHFGVCGGCQQQHASVALQQVSKKRALERMMKHEVSHIIDAQPWGYRRRVRLSLKYSAPEKKLQMGFRKTNSHELVDIGCCPIMVPGLEALLAPLRICLDALQGARSLGHVELVQADSGILMVLRHTQPLSAHDKEKLERFSQTHDVALFLAGGSDTLECLYGDQPWYVSQGLRLQFSPRDFIQVNDAVNQQMVAQAIDWLALTPDDRVLDLFCGMGNFTLPIARHVATVTGVEGVSALVASARHNARYHNLENISFWLEDLDRDAVHQPWARQSVDKVLLDPARAGAAGVMRQIAALAPSRVVYVSCNPSTLARDSAELCSSGYRLMELKMLDMFPHTGHLESMALFERC
ncbi:23S rRNA (uracil(1939)-C(5))-methyltransferase RlmD [Erwinia sp. HR93]|uniref:23S rRNA (uracil(1939)-C(5))-methyltransferase RlmD n=1 Tax=Erwinia sp. HR93 TaxID=3094840 RepID=UPI002ADEF661|nr:23S rRNA (uracil(1939)-C(5))-methyltransferase RlmD [Erwinia sp. HR93]MEA1064154.1 23S rRNA (uracil(1939)-C(5))-methyltransferase RlmD [Erwinia sp. HR93]